MDAELRITLVSVIGEWNHIMTLAISLLSMPNLILWTILSAVWFVSVKTSV